MLMFYNVFDKSKENVFVPINIPLQGTIDQCVLNLCIYSRISFLIHFNIAVFKTDNKHKLIVLINIA